MASGSAQPRFRAVSWRRRGRWRQATLYKDLFIFKGLPATFLADLEGLIAEFDRAVNGKYRGAARRIGARAELRALAHEFIVLAERLDGNNFYRFEGDAEKRVAWQAAAGAGAVVVGEIRAAEF